MLKFQLPVLFVCLFLTFVNHSDSDVSHKNSAQINSFTHFSLSYLNQKLDSAHFFYKNNALYLAADQLKLIEKTDFSNYTDSIRMKVGELYQLLSHIYYDIGNYADIKNCIDSMYWYKNSAKSNNPEIKSEYFTYLSRFYALEMKTYTSKAAIDSALYYFHQSTSTSLQQKYFLIYNYLNILRNTRDTFNQLTLEKGVPDHLKLADQYINSIEKMDIPWYIKSFCYRVRGNIYQDQFWNYTRNEKKNQKQLQLTLDKINTAENYSKKINGIYDISGLHMNLVRALQYNYIDSFEVSNQIIDEVISLNQINIDGKTFFRNIPMALFCNKYKVINITDKINAMDVSPLEAEMLLQNCFELTKLYKIFVLQYMKNDPSFISEGYNKNVLHDIFNLSEYLYFKTGEERYKELAWNYSNQKKYISLLFKTLNHYFNRDFSKIVDQLEEIDWRKNYLLDQFYLAQTGKIRIDTHSVKREILQWDQAYDRVVNNAPTLLKKYFLDQPFESIHEIQKRMDKEEIILNYDFSGHQYKNPNYVMVVKKNCFELLSLKNDTTDIKEYLQETNFIKSHLRNLLNYYSDIYIFPIKKYLKNCKKIIVIPFYQIEYLSFDMLLNSQTVSDQYEDMDFIGLKYNIRYTPGMNVEYLLNTTSDYQTDSVLVIAPDYKDSKVANRLPFHQKLANYLSKKFKSVSIKKNSELIQHHGSTYSVIHFAAHQYLNPNVHKMIRHAPQTFNEKQILFEDSTINEQDLHLKNMKADIAIVSSCFSGVSYLDCFDGKINISKIFIENGVKSVITVPWRLDDYASAAILKEFYRLIYKGHDRSDALWSAKIHFLKTHNDPTLRNPLFWAGFRMSGKDGPIEMEPKINKQVWILLGIGLIGSLFVYILFKKRRAFL